VLAVDIPEMSVDAPCCSGVPVSDHNLSRLQCVEDFGIEQLIAQLAVEALAIAILPWTSRFDVRGLGSDGADPIPERLGNELGTVV
jgi:hypothetical protein